MAPANRRKARIAVTGSALKLHLGCGQHYLDGWLNVDLVGARADLVWDIRHELPFDPATAGAVFLEHVLEHMTYADGFTVLRNARAVLEPGGVLRIGVPDAGRYARMYAADPGELLLNMEGRPTAICALREVFQEHGHVSAWDGETLCLFATEAGFESAQIMPAGVSRLSPAPDLESRWAESVYVEALRPNA
jgi:predicted SAM-dependent methyltransferase